MVRKTQMSWQKRGDICHVELCGTLLFINIESHCPFLCENCYVCVRESLCVHMPECMWMRE